MKTVLITGASRGIGAETARLFAQKGWAVAVNYRNSREAAEELVSEIRKNGGTALAIPADVGDPEQVDLIAATLQKRPFHKVAVFNGAGGYDELTTMGKTRIVLITDGVMDEMVFDPSLYGFVPCEPEDLEVRDKEEATAVLKELLAGRGPRAMRDMVTVNAAFAIYMLEDDKPLEECVAMARKGVAEGAGMRVLS